MADPGFAAVVTLMRFQGIGADPDQILHKFGHSQIGVAGDGVAPKDLGLKARSYPDELAVATRQPALRSCATAASCFLARSANAA
jgi:ATP-binding cassette, subfamily B, bacterial HlyB/CyaB